MNMHDEVSYFLVLQSLTLQQLQERCQKANLPQEGHEADLISRLMFFEQADQDRVFLPQAVPLRTLGRDGSPLPDAVETFKRWRKLIFQGKNNWKSFSLLNGEGKEYQAKLRFAKCSVDTVKMILDRHWFFAQPNQDQLLESLKKTPELFDFHIIQKPSGKGNSWLMIHVEPKKEAA